MTERFGFNYRSKQSQLQAIKRYYPDQGTDYANRFVSEFVQDTQVIENSLAWFKLADVYQFSLNYDFTTRNRLSHTVDAQQIAEEIARRLKLSDESIILAGNVARVHDFGHMPFAHRGEVAAQKALQPYGLSWNHDVSGLRLITEWLKFSPAFSGLNLTHDVIEGLAKRFWRYDPTQPIGRDNHDRAELPEIITELEKQSGMNLHLDKFNHLEGQIAAQSDRLAFTVSDLEDGLKTKRINLQSLTLHFPLAVELYEQTLAEFITEFQRNHPQAKDLRQTIEANDGIQIYLFTLFADRFKEYLVTDIVENATRNLADYLEANPQAQAEDIRSSSKLMASFSLSVDQQLRQFGRYCREVVFQKTAPLETLVAKVIDLYVSEKLPLPAQWQLEWEQAENQGKRIELVCKYLTCEVGDRDLLEIAKQHIPGAYEEYFPGFESITGEVLTEEQVHNLLQHKQADQQAHTAVGLPTIYLSQIRFGKDLSVPVISSAKKFVVPVPSQGETIQIPHDGYFLSGEKFYQGDPLKTVSGEIIGGAGVVFFNQTDDQWVAAQTGFNGLQRSVIIFNQVSVAQAEALAQKLLELAPEPEQITLAQIKELLDFAQTLGLANKYPSKILDVKQYMEPLGEGESSLLAKFATSPYGYKQRKKSIVCQATYIPGRGKFQQLFGNPQRFYNGAVLLKHPNQRVHVIQPEVIENTYVHADGSKLEVFKLPVQNIQIQELDSAEKVNGEFTHIAIIGGGVSGIMAITKIVHEFLEKVPPETNLKFTLVEPAPKLGGPTYNRYGVNIGMANPIKDLGFDKASSCVEHFNRNPEKWQSILHQVKYDPTTGFDPASIIQHNQYGEYVRSHFNSLITWLKSKNYPISFDIVQDQVIDIDSSDNQTTLSLESGKQLSAHACVVCIGNVAPKPLVDKNGASLAGRKGYYNLDDHGLSPENVNETDFTVLVGTGNGALFAVIAAVQNGYRGKFLLTSRSGKTPAVAMNSVPYTRKIFTLENIELQTKRAQLTADFLYQLFQQELELARTHEFTWRDVVDSLFSDTNKIWRMLGGAEQEAFAKKYGVDWGHARYRLPNDHHQFIQKLVEEGRVEITGGLEGITVLPTGEFSIELKNPDGTLRQVITKKIVNNSGPTKLLKYMPTIIEKLSSKGLVRQHPGGGLDIDELFRVKQSSGIVNPRIYAIGPIVSGAFLEAMTVPAIRLNAEVMADALVQNLIVDSHGRYDPLFTKIENSSQLDYARANHQYKISQRLK